MSAEEKLSNTVMAEDRTKSFAETIQTPARGHFASVMPCLLDNMSELLTLTTLGITCSGPYKAGIQQRMTCVPLQVNT